MFYLAIQSGLVLAQEADGGDPQGSALGTLLFFALIIGGGYLLFIRPQRRRVKAMDDLRSSIEVGSEIRTVGGIYGTILELDDEVVVLDVGGGGRLRVARRAVAENLSVAEVPDVEDDAE